MRLVPIEVLCLLSRKRKNGIRVIKVADIGNGMAIMIMLLTGRTMDSTLGISRRLLLEIIGIDSMKE